MKRFLRKPPWWVVTITYLYFLVTAGLSIYLTFFEDRGPIKYLLYVLAVTSLLYAIHCTIFIFKYGRYVIISVLEKTHLGRRMLASYGFRTTIYTSVTFFFILGYSIFEGVLAYTHKSIWYLGLSVYHFIFGSVKLYIILSYFKYYANKKNDEFNWRKYQFKVYLKTGILISVMDLIMIVPVVMVVKYGAGYTFYGTLIYAYALWAVYKITMAIINLVSARRHHKPIIQALRDISLSDALMTVFALQTALLALFGNGMNVKLANGITGGFVLFCTLVTSVMMVIRSSIKLRRLNKTKEVDQNDIVLIDNSEDKEV